MGTVNTTGFAHCYMQAATLLMDAIATPTADGFTQALKWAGYAYAAGYHTGPTQRIQPGSDQSLAVSLRDSIKDAALFYGYRI